METIIKNVFFLNILLVLCSAPLFAQSEAVPYTARNAVYFELGGNGGIYSVNYERIFYQKGIFKSAGRVGLSIVPGIINSKTDWYPIMPLEIVGILGRNRNNLELGIGISPTYYPQHGLNSQTSEFELEKYRLSSFIPFRIGYRYQKPDGGLVFRIAYTPVIYFPGQRDKPYYIYMFGGISIGKSF